MKSDRFELVRPRSLLEKAVWPRQGLLCLGLWLLAVLLPLLVQPPQQRLFVDIGAEEALNDYGESRAGFYLFDMNYAEADENGQSFRWTKAFSSLRFLNYFALGEPLLLELRACDCRPAETQAATSTLRLNYAPALELPLDGNFRTYRFLVPHKPSDYGNDLYLELRGNTFEVPNSEPGAPPRQLGIRLDWVRVAPLVDGWQIFGLPLWLAWLLYAGAMLGALLLGWRFLPLWSTALVLVLQAGILLSLPFVYRPHIFTPPLLALLCLVALWGSFAIGRNLTQRLGLALASLWSVWSVQILGFWILDDAYISFRYALNMLQGHGLVFNPGERVEGYTNFLWTMLMAIPIGLGFDPTLPSAIATMLIGLATIWLVYAWGLRLASAHEGASIPQRLAHSLLPLTAPLLLALNTPFMLYGVRGSGMETALFSLLLVAGSWAVHEAGSARQCFRAGLIFALMVMTRPDGVLAVAMAGLYLLARSLPDWLKARPSLGALLRSPLANYVYGFLICFGPYYLWRYLYYGYPLPNTFYAKVGSGWAQYLRGLNYSYEFAASMGWRFLTVVFLLGLIAVWWRVWRGKAFNWQVLRLETLHVIGLIALYLLYIIYVGGDHFPGFRFFVPLIPLIALLIQQALLNIAQLRIGLLKGLEAWPAPLGALALALLYLVFTAYQLPSSDIGVAWSPVRGEYNVVEKNRELGLWLRDNTPADTVVATGIAGALPYYSGLRVIDTLGLNDLHIAHLEVEDMGAGIAGAEKTDVEYVLDQQPHIIPFSTSGTFQNNPRFQANYHEIEIRGPEGRASKLFILGTQPTGLEPK